MELLSSRAEAAIDRLTRFAYGDQALVATAQSMYGGKIPELVEYIRKHRRKPEHAAPNSPIDPNPVTLK